MKTTLYLVRHAESTARADGVVQGVGRDVPLTPDGQRHAAALAKNLAHIRFDRIFASETRRARDTAAPMVAARPDIPYEELSALNERSKGPHEGMKKTDYEARFPDVIAAWQREEDARPPGGESYADVEKRMLPVIETHVAEFPGQTLLYVIHGNVIKVLVGAWLHMPAGRRARLKTDYCSITIASYDDERSRWQIECLNRTV